MLGRGVDRPPYWLYWGPWGTTWRRWQDEAMPQRFADFADVRRHLGAEPPPHVVGVNCGPCPKLGPRVLEETDAFVVSVDSWGIRRRDLKGHTSMSEFIEFPVKGRDDWRRYRDEHLAGDDPRRVEGDWAAKAAAAARAGVPIQLGSYPDVGIYGSLRWLLGDEECLLAFYDAPRLVHEIMDHMTDVYLAVFEKVVAAGVLVDVIHIWEDMCGRQGPLISPRHFEEFMAPCYRRIKAFAEAHGIGLISVDTDGRCDAIIPPMTAAGVNYLFPFEVAAGSDVNAVRAAFPDLAMMGGIDKRALARGKEAIDAELQRIRPAVEAGRYIPDLDHLIPDDVSWENFCHYAEALRELVGKEH